MILKHVIPAFLVGYFTGGLTIASWNKTNELLQIESAVLGRSLMMSVADGKAAFLRAATDHVGAKVVLALLLHPAPPPIKG
jgi:hypothetical protein